MSELEQLLVVQEHDIAIDRLRHRRDTLPERARLGEVEDTLVDLQMRLTEVEERRGVVVRGQTQLEDEIASLGAKITELDKKLYSGTVSSPRELQAMQADIDSLKRHRSELEDKVLEVMEEREPLDAEVARLLTDRAGLDEQSMVLRAEIAEAESDIV